MHECERGNTEGKQKHRHTTKKTHSTGIALVYRKTYILQTAYNEVPSNYSTAWVHTATQSNLLPPTHLFEVLAGIISV